MKMKNISRRSKNMILFYRSFSSLLKIAEKLRKTIRCCSLVDSMTNQFFTDKEVGGTWARIPSPKKPQKMTSKRFHQPVVNNCYYYYSTRCCSVTVIAQLEGLRNLKICQIRWTVLQKFQSYLTTVFTFSFFCGFTRGPNSRATRGFPFIQPLAPAPNWKNGTTCQAVVSVSASKFLDKLSAALAALPKFY